MPHCRLLHQFIDQTCILGVLAANYRVPKCGDQLWGSMRDSLLQFLTRLARRRVGYLVGKVHLSFLSFPPRLFCVLAEDIKLDTFIYIFRSPSRWRRRRRSRTASSVSTFELWRWERKDGKKLGDAEANDGTAMNRNTGTPRESAKVTRRFSTHDPSSSEVCRALSTPVDPAFQLCAHCAIPADTMHLHEAPKLLRNCCDSG